MRTTVTLDPDTEQLLRRRMEQRGVSFKKALNDAIRAGLAAPSTTTEFRTEPASLGTPAFDLDKALAIAGRLEDEELLAKMRRSS